MVQLVAASDLLMEPSANWICTSTVSFFHFFSLLASLPNFSKSLIRLSHASVILVPRSVLMELLSSLSTSALRLIFPFSEISATPLLFWDCSSTAASLSILLYRNAAATPTLESCWALSCCLFSWPVTVWERDVMSVLALIEISPPGTGFPSASAIGFPCPSFLTASPIAFSSTPGATMALAVFVLSTTPTAAPAVTYSSALLKAFSRPCSLPP